MSIKIGKELQDTYLLTDTLPEEIPIIYTNFTLYDYILTSTDWNRIDDINDKKKFLSSTVPYLFTIKKNTNGNRLLGLIHPVAQLLLTKFNTIYDLELLEYFNINDQFSIRAPKKVIRQKKIPHGMDVDEINNWIKSVVKYYYGYKYVKITDFYNSQLFLNCELKYKHLYKLDIQSFFDSIYTHSIEWAYVGNKEIAKKNRTGIYNLGGLIDNLYQAINYGETNGIIVGPEASRVISEIISTRVDTDVYNSLVKNNINKDLDYNIVRFLDDIYIFSNDENICKNIKNLYEEKLVKYKLKLNHNKSDTEIRPYSRKHLWTRPVFQIIKNLDAWFSENDGLVGKSIIRKNIQLRNTVIQDIKQVLVEYIEQENYIISYIVTSLTSIIRRTKFIHNFKELASRSKMVNCNAKIVLENYNSKIKTIYEILHYSLVISPNYKNATYFTSSSYSIYNGNRRLERYIFNKCNILLKNNIENLSELLNIIIFMSALNYDISDEIISSLLRKKNEYFNISVLSYYLSHNIRRYKKHKAIEQINNIILDVLDNLKYEYKITRRGGYDCKVLKELLSDQKIIWLQDFYTCPIIKKTVIIEIDKIFDRIEKSLSNIQEQFPLQYIYGKFVVEKKDSFMKWDMTSNDIRKEINLRIKNRINSIY